MICPECGSNQTWCFDSRHSKDEKTIWRRRRCNDCGHRWTTYEFAVKSKDESEQAESCLGCEWCGKRHQKCSCCRRNPILKDCYEVG